MIYDVRLIGILSCLIVGVFPFVYYLFEKFSNKKLLLLATFLFIIVETYLESRLGFVSIIIQYVYLKKYYIKSNNIFLLFIFACFFISCILYFKLNSTVGRYFIYKTILSNISTVPFLGFGFNSFKLVYSQWQSNLFINNVVWDKFHLLADAPSYAFNELLHFYIEFGVISVLMYAFFTFLNCRILFKSHVNSKIFAISSLSILFYSLFSYPFHSFWILLLFLNNHLIILGISLQRSKFTIFLSLCFFIFGIYYFYRPYLVGKEVWKFASVIPISEKKEKLKAYNEAFLNLSKDQYFLFDYANYLNSINFNNQTIDLIKKQELYFNQYQKFILLSEIYYKNNNLKLCSEALINANYLIPNRYIPLAGLLKLSEINNDTLLISYYSNKILAMPVKVPSVIVSEIKNKANNALRSLNKASQ